LPSLSSDELATTPARPTFVFRKPARYVAREGDGLGRIHLGWGRERRGGRGRRRAREVEVWDESEDGGGGGMVERVEDEIEDDFAWRVIVRFAVWVSGGRYREILLLWSRPSTL